MQFASKVKQAPERQALDEFATAVKTHSVKRQDITPTVSATGTVKAAFSWEAVSEVAGQVVWLSPKVKDGALLPQGEELLRIDHSGYQLALAQVEAQLARSKVQDQATEDNIEAEQHNVRLLQQEFERQQKLAHKGSVLASVRDTAERNWRNALKALQALKNTLAVSAAEQAVLQVQRRQAQLNLLHTVIVAPRDIRITGVDIAEQQYTTAGKVLFSADGLHSAEVSARFALGDLRPLLAGTRNPQTDEHGFWKPNVIGLPAQARLKVGKFEARWEGQISRLQGSLDAQTQTIGVVAEIDDPYGRTDPGKRPPLSRNLFVELAITGQTLSDQLVIPANTIRNGKVFLMDAENRLQVRSVKLKFRQKNLAVVREGLKPGDRLVMSDLVAAVPGMLLKTAP